MFCEVTGRERDGFGDVVRADAEYLIDDLTSPIKGRRAICQQQCAAIAPKPTRRHTLEQVSVLPKPWAAGYRHPDMLSPRFHNEKDTNLSGTSVTVCRTYSPDKPPHFPTRFRSETPQYVEALAERLPRDVALRGTAPSKPASLSAALERPTQGTDGARGVSNHLSPRNTTADKAGLGKTRPLSITFIDRT